MDERYAFWKSYKYSIYGMGTVSFITGISCRATGDLTAVLNVGGSGHSSRVIVYQIVIFSSVPIFIGMVAFGIVFCFIEIIILVWYITLSTNLNRRTTSSKIAKLLRTDDRPLVFALRRKMYVYVSAGAFISLLIIADCFLDRFAFVPVLAIVFEQLVLHFLEFVRLGVKNLDEYELISRSATIPVDLDGISNVTMDSSAPGRHSEVYSKLGEMSRT
jgi:hypothetical protein